MEIPSMYSIQWNSRAERSADSPAIRDINRSAFETSEEANLVDALLTRCHIDDTPALCLAPCAVLSEHQHSGAGSAAIRAALIAAKEMGEK